ncbi:hypothetical protein [Dehalococcoides mccartyi]|uniref:hypothetical protein n=1 Tax=Dehalococcoides mccartyi TaxID=61435 RepID=UPI0002B767E4|nr:hypothetical protein [Dehalococcoides mccartyi]AGG05939.1 hypothetical protein dcmb_308 [Dehalococcoides mccartyi DCMB5]
MSKEWFNAESFERFQQLISAINAVLIHSKLRLAGIDDAERRPEFETSRKYLLAFLEQFGPIVQEVERDENWVPAGTDPRLDDLARSLADIRRRRPRKFSLASVSVVELKQLLELDDIENASRVIEYLRDLRNLLEQQAHADVISILGEL